MLGNLTVLISAYVAMRAFEALAGVVPQGVLRGILQVLIALFAVAHLFLAPVIVVDTLSNSLEMSRQQQELRNMRY